MQEVGNAQTSPDGKWIAYTVTSIDREADKRLSSVWMVNWEGTQDVRLTYGPESATSPHWSPDGRYLAFLSSRPPDEKTQIWLLDRRGGEARQLTKVKENLSDFAWSPDSKKLVLEMSRSDEDSSATAKTADATSSAPKPIVIDRYHFKNGESYLTDTSNTQLYLFDIEAQKLDPLTTDRKFSDSDPVWSPDGGRIAYISNHDANPHSFDTDKIFLIEARAGAIPKELPNTYEPGGPVAWSPDSKFLAYLAGLEQKYTAYNLNRVGLISIADGVSRILTEKLDRGVSSLEFTADGSAVSFLVTDDRRQYLAKIAVSGGATERLSGSNFVILQRSSTAGHTAVTASSDTVAPEIFALESGELRRLTRHNDSLLSEIQLGAVQDISFKSKDGTEIHGMMVKPPDFDPSHKYPTLLWIHGGPNGQDSHALLFNTYPLQVERQFFAAHGYVVLAINYRGSSGRGAEFTRSIFADWGNKEVADLLAAADFAVAVGLPTRSVWRSEDGAMVAYLLIVSLRPTHVSKPRLAERELGMNFRCTAATSTSCNTTTRLVRPGSHWRLGLKFPTPFFTQIAFTRPRCSWVATPTLTCP